MKRVDGRFPAGDPDASRVSKPISGHEHFGVALAAAQEGLAEGGVPIGAALVLGGEVLAVGRNRRIQQGDPTAHAEIDCLRQGGRGIAYPDGILISTLAPCMMCSGAIVQFGIPRVLVGEATNFAGELEFLRSRGVDVEVLDDQQATQMMAEFIAGRPTLWNEDIGVFG